MERLHLLTFQNGARSSGDTPLNDAVAPFLVFQWCGCTSGNPFNGAAAPFNALEK